tara:strand:- start:4716 stop:5702 length:987 start_codon:yes stop_codon:yes gene_type:complete
MIVSKTPLRMSFIGGGSDLPAYYIKNKGAVISTSIKKYVYIALHPKFDNNFRLSYSKTEDVTHIKDIEHPLFRETLDFLEIKNGLEISSMADIPSKGSGLGSSSSFTVGLLNALYAYKNINPTKSMLAEQACNIEIIRCGEKIGKQDQYAASFGGLNLIEFNQNGSVDVNPLNADIEFIDEFEKNIIVFFTGITRKASSILVQQSNYIKNSDTKTKILDKMVDLCYVFKNEVENNDIKNLGKILDENWNLKKSLVDKITNPIIEEIYSIAKNNGAAGGKLLGAGSGGFVMFIANPKYHDQIRNKLSNLKEVNFKFDSFGSEIILNTNK